MAEDVIMLEAVILITALRIFFLFFYFLPEEVVETRAQTASYLRCNKQEMFTVCFIPETTTSPGENKM